MDCFYASRPDNNVFRERFNPGPAANRRRLTPLRLPAKISTRQHLLHGPFVPVTKTVRSPKHFQTVDQNRQIDDPTNISSKRLDAKNRPHNRC